MKIIIAPAKKMIIDRDSFPVQSEPEFLLQTKELAAFLQERNFDQLKEIWQASDKVITASQKQLQDLNLTAHLTPAIIAYSGIQYQYMAPDLFTAPALSYIQDKLRIVSGFYGLLRPFDGVCPYRLEMRNKLVGFREPSLYRFWGRKLADSLFADDEIVINLASQEYSKAISPYLKSTAQLITVDFQEEKNGKWRTMTTHAKMSRGMMVRFIAEAGITHPEELKQFSDFGYQFVQVESKTDHYVFRTKFDFKRH